MQMAYVDVLKNPVTAATFYGRKLGNVSHVFEMRELCSIVPIRCRRQSFSPRGICLCSILLHVNHRMGCFYSVIKIVVVVK